MKQKLFFWIYLSVTQKEASLPNTPTFGSWTVAIHGDSMCLRTCVYPPSANTQRSGTSPVAVCALVLPRGTIAWPVFMFVSFSCPWNRRPSPSPEETQAKTKPNEETKRLTDKTSYRNVKIKVQFTWSLFFWGSKMKINCKISKPNCTLRSRLGNDKYGITIGPIDFNNAENSCQNQFIKMEFGMELNRNMA